MGRWQDAPNPLEFSIYASIQPANGRNDMETVPEGRRQSEAYRIYTSTELLPAGSENPDIAIIGGAEFEIYQNGVWQNGIIDHYKYVVVKRSAAA